MIASCEDILTFTVEHGDENAFPNLQIALQIMLTMAVSMAVSIVNCERYFSKLKLMFSYHPSRGVTEGRQRGGESLPTLAG